MMKTSVELEIKKVDLAKQGPVKTIERDAGCAVFGRKLMASGEDDAVTAIRKFR